MGITFFALMVAWLERSPGSKGAQNWGDNTDGNAIYFNSALVVVV